MLRVICLLMFGLGVAVLLLADWRVAVGVFLLAWADNLSKKAWP